MTEKIRKDLHISGIMGGSGGGVYNMVRIDGQATIHGGLDCVGFVCNGRASLNGPFKADSVEVNGTASFGGQLNVGKMRISGKADMAGPVSAGSMRIDGHGKIAGNLSGETVEINGMLSVKGDCDAESFQARGCFRIDGLLNAEKIEVDLMVAECRAKEIGGETIVIRKSTTDSAIGKLVKALIFSQDKLVAGVIEGDEIHLEHTKAEVVRGRNVTIGPGCDIGLVEYRDQFKPHPDAKVGRSERL